MGQPLTRRETEVLGCVAEGLSNKCIADRLHLSGHTVKFHLSNAAKKLGASSRTRAAVDFTLQRNTTLVVPGSESGNSALTTSKDDDWIKGFAVALALVHRHGGSSTAIYKAALAAGLTLATVHDAGVSASDISELKRARIS